MECPVSIYKQKKSALTARQNEHDLIDDLNHSRKGVDIYSRPDFMNIDLDTIRRVRSPEISVRDILFS